MRSVRYLVTAGVGAIGALAATVLAYRLYVEWWTPTGCDDVVHPRETS
jgi:hypothetical protein